LPGWAGPGGRAAQGLTYEDGIAAALFLLGLRLLTTGKLLSGAVLMTGAMLWAAYRRVSHRSADMSPGSRAPARFVRECDPADIRDAHRR
jgi:hypothetical protein